ncbi:MAG TPA: hypothetical protein VNG51_28545 [Ktedonobacteraceae bacterium]|nr:hypothetical protein [Ktedonobacteraceae bacterium]
METQEERLLIMEFDLKRFKTETIKAYGDMAYEMVIVKGLSEDSIRRLAKLSETMEKRFERVDTRLDGMDVHLESMDGRLNQMDTHLNQMDSRLNRLETTLSEHTALFAQILARLPEKP